MLKVRDTHQRPRARLANTIGALLATPFLPREVTVAPLALAVESPPFPFDVASETRVRDALIAAVVRHTKTLSELQRATEECVRHLRDQGMLPEAMIITMKAFLRYTGVNHPPPGYPTTWPTEPVLERIIEWCIIEYFRDPLPS